MKIVLEDFIYQGIYHNRYEVELPNIEEVEELEDRIQEYIRESLEDLSEYIYNMERGL